MGFGSPKETRAKCPELQLRESRLWINIGPLDGHAMYENATVWQTVPDSLAVRRDGFRRCTERC